MKFNTKFPVNKNQTGKAFIAAISFIFILLISIQSAAAFVGHTASQITSGNFSTGNFTFLNDLYVTQNLGIGTTAPERQLEIKNTVAGGSPTLRISNDGTLNGNMTLELRRNDADAGIIKLIPGGEEGGLRIGTTHSSGDIRLYTLSDIDLNSNERIRVTDAGLIGIGTMAPLSKLHVKGNVSLNDTLYVTENNKVGIGTATPRALLELGSTSSTNAQRLVINPGGSNNTAGMFNGLFHNDMIIGSFNDESSVSHGFISTGYSSTSRKISIGRANQSDFASAIYQPLFTVVSDTGRVGIGTESPEAKLSLYGSEGAVSGELAPILELRTPDSAVGGNSMRHFFGTLNGANKNRMLILSSNMHNNNTKIETGFGMAQLMINPNDQNSEVGSGFTFKTALAASNNLTTRFVILQDGNVGIGLL